MHLRRAQLVVGRKRHEGSTNQSTAHLVLDPAWFTSHQSTPFRVAVDAKNHSAWGNRYLYLSEYLSLFIISRRLPVQLVED